MDNNPQSAKPISDDQELAKVLAGVNQTADEPLQFDTPPVITPPADATTPAAATTSDDASSTLPTPAPVTPAEESTPEKPEDSPIVGYNPPEPAASSPSPSTTEPSGDLSTIKQEALSDLRPLVDKLDIAPEEKFDTYLLLIRSTDDKTLIQPAYSAAQAITDESRKAQALLDVIKEIDYLSNPQK